MSARLRCWQRTRRCWRAWLERRISAGGVTGYRSRLASAPLRPNRPKRCRNCSKGHRTRCCRALRRVETVQHPRRGGRHVCHHRHSRRLWSGHRRLPDGERQYRGSPSARGAADHCGCGHRHAAGCQSGAHPQGILTGLKGVLGGSKFGKERYLDTLRMMYQFLNKVRREGLLSVENDAEKPAESMIFKEYPEFLNDHHARDFLCDTLRTAITGGVEPFDMDQMMELDMEVHHHGAMQPVNALTTVADALPGLGIVAAVLGVVITMGSLGGPPEAIGHKVAAALVGTFLGILLCYGLVGPIGSYMGKEAEEEHAFLYVLRVLMVSFIKGNAPVQSVEIARWAIPMNARPTFEEVEAACHGPQASEAAAEQKIA